jgi:hypothetical protein
MAKRGFFKTLLVSSVVAVVSYFVIYFFIPSMGVQYLGTTFTLREGSPNALMLDTITQEGLAVDLSMDAGRRFMQLLNTRESQKQIKSAMAGGAQALSDLAEEFIGFVK